MKLVNIVIQGQTQLGIRLDSGIITAADLSALVEKQGLLTESLPQTLEELFLDESALSRLQAALMEVAGGLEHANGSFLLSEDEVQLAPVVPAGTKVICIGINYGKHSAETNIAAASTPIVFSKFSNALAAHGESIPLPKHSRQIDYEGELAVVIGKRASSVSRDEALHYVLGYCNSNDVSARDIQFRTSQWLLGKTYDKFAPVGPYLVTADEVGDPNQLNIRTYVNGEIRQNSHTSDMIFDVRDLIHELSHNLTLEPGDVILTGTPEGVILGLPEDERVWLSAGDEVTVEIDKLGRLTNTFRE